MTAVRKTIVISGGCGGLGQAIGQRLARDGWEVIALYLDTPPEAAAAAVKNFGSGNHQAIHCDIREAEQVRKVMTNIVSDRGGIQAALHAAVDPIARQYFLDLDAASFRGQFETGVFGGFNFLRAAARVMKEQNEGRILGILSEVLFSERASKMAGYVAAKHALRGMLRQLALELSATEIKVNALAPGFMNTPLNRDLPEQVANFVTERGGAQPLAEVADLAAKLLSDETGLSGKIFIPGKDKSLEL